MLLKVKKQDVATLLIAQHGFKFVASDVDNYFYIEPPANLSNTRARKMVSKFIKLSLARQDLIKAKEKYNKVAEEINKILTE